MATQEFIGQLQAQLDTTQAELEAYKGNDQDIIDHLTKTRDSAQRCLDYPDGIPPEAVAD